MADVVISKEETAVIVAALELLRKSKARAATNDANGPDVRQAYEKEAKLVANLGQKVAQRELVLK